MSNTNISTATINREFLQERQYRRVGSCRGCLGICCNFLTFPMDWPASDYFGMHGIIMKDRWIPSLQYVVIGATCRQCVAGKCCIFDKKNMPEACRQFPCAPWDCVWRYLKQIGTSCRIDFVDVLTGKPWDMRRTQRLWGGNDGRRGTIKTCNAQIDTVKKD